MTGLTPGERNALRWAKGEFADYEQTIASLRAQVVDQQEITAALASKIDQAFREGRVLDAWTIARDALAAIKGEDH